MNPGKVSSIEIQQQIDRLGANVPASELHYYSLLQVVLFPHTYQAETPDVALILSALRGSEHNLGAIKMSVILNRLLTPGSQFDDLTT